MYTALDETDMKIKEGTNLNSCVIKKTSAIISFQCEVLPRGFRKNLHTRAISEMLFQSLGSQVIKHHILEA